MKQLYLSSLVLLLLFNVARADEIDNVAQLLKQGNAQKLSELFAPNIELTINGQDDNDSKQQATDVINQFFNSHRPVSVQVLHKVNTGKKFVFGVASYSSNNGNFRIAYTIDITGGGNKIVELRIEPEKTK